jgi:hypothetical protein
MVPYPNVPRVHRSMGDLLLGGANSLCLVCDRDYTSRNAIPERFMQVLICVVHAIALSIASTRVALLGSLLIELFFRRRHDVCADLL